MIPFCASHYHPPSLLSWQGREDTTAGRLFQQIQLLDCNHLPTLLPKGSIVLLGFASDEGVKRNLGQLGAGEAPEVFRRVLGNLPLSSSHPIWDAGTIFCHDGDLEQAQQCLGKMVATLKNCGAFVITLGGGHEVAWGNFQGLAASCTDTTLREIDVLNFDAHFDLRPLLPQGKGSSGTSFSQIHDYCKTHQIASRYACFGIQPFGNTHELFEKADSLKTTYCLAETMVQDPQLAHQTLASWLSAAQQVHLSLCLDVFATAYAPGVSAPQALGLSPHQLLPFFRDALKTKKVIGFDIAELNPRLDHHDQTAKLAAHFVGEVIQSCFN